MTEALRNLWKTRRGTVIAMAAVALLIAGFGLVRLGRTAPRIPTAEVTRGDFVDWVQLRGEVKARQSLVLTAPSSAGDIQIVKLPKNGAPVKKGDIVVLLDTTQLQTTLDQKRSEWKTSEGEIEKARAQSKLTEEQDQTDLLKAKYDVERARLDVKKEEVISQIDAEKNKLALADAGHRLRESEQKLASDRLGVGADIEGLKQKREKALFEVRQAETNIARMTLRAPVDGVATLLPNFRAGGFFGNSPEFKEGDRAWPGASIVELPNLATLYMAVRVDETDRGRLATGQTASVRVDAIPDRELKARVSDISPMAKPDFSNWPPAKNFDVGLELGDAEQRLRPGMSATVRVAADRVPNSILIPAEAVFQHGGRAIVYVQRGSKFEPREIQVARRSASQVLVARGLSAGESVALKDPTIKEAK